MRRVTDDVPRDRAPMFTPDGRSLVFYSNRDGNWALWMVAMDGGNLRKVAGDESGAVYVESFAEGGHGYLRRQLRSGGVLRAVRASRGRIADAASRYSG